MASPKRNVPISTLSNLFLLLVNINIVQLRRNKESWPLRRTIRNFANTFGTSDWRCRSLSHRRGWTRRGWRRPLRCRWRTRCWWLWGRPLWWWRPRSGGWYHRRCSHAVRSREGRLCPKDPVHLRLFCVCSLRRKTSCFSP